MAGPVHRVRGVGDARGLGRRHPLGAEARAALEPGPARRRRPARCAPPPDRGPRARSGARRRARRRVGHADRRRAGYGQEHARVAGARRDVGRRRAVPARVRGGVGRAGAPARRPPRRARARPPRRVRHVAPRRVARTPRRRVPTCSRSTRSRPCRIPTRRAARVRCSQVRDGAVRAQRLAKELGVATLLVGHVTKDGSLAGPRTLEHVVDTVLVVRG